MDHDLNVNFKTIELVGKTSSGSRDRQRVLRLYSETFTIKEKY